MIYKDLKLIGLEIDIVILYNDFSKLDIEYELLVENLRCDDK